MNIVRIRFEAYKDYEVESSLEESVKEAKEKFLDEERGDFNNAKYIDITDVSIFKRGN